jgi:hypothetical protein
MQKSVSEFQFIEDITHLKHLQKPSRPQCTPPGLNEICNNGQQFFTIINKYRAEDWPMETTVVETTLKHISC